MLDNYTLTPANTFNNPFDDINANTLEPQRILSLWCDPFSVELLKGTSEKNFASLKTPIILQGSRGSGKTMILKYFSYPVLKERAKNNSEKSITKQIIEEKSIGFYFRCDDSFVNTFQSIFKSQSRKEWLSFFEHYLELQFCTHILSVVEDVCQESNNSKTFEEEYFKKLFANSVLVKEQNINSFSDLSTFLQRQLYYIDAFKNNSIFLDSEFKTDVILDLYSLSERMITALNESVSVFEDIIYLILVDEFENMTEDIQRFFNTKIKFVHQKISYRIGRRCEGTTTTETINKTEYLRDGHDYLLIDISRGMSDKLQKEYFAEMAAKRLDDAKFGCIDIRNMIGAVEDLDEECLDICKGKDKHLRIILSERSSIKKDSNLCDKIIAIIKNPQNPIMETLNALWVIRRKESPEEAAEIARSAMLGFINKQDNDIVHKYNNDYLNKYRYTITALLASIYKREKLYYSFNTIVHLADGNSRTFINICRSIISDALFYERDNLLVNKKVSPRSQSRAIHEFSTSEFESVCSIINYGSNVRNLLLNIGNVLMEYHKDKKARYPETTQFTFDNMQIQDEDKKVVDIALGWTMIIKKEKTQRLSMSINQKGDIYYINRAFSPMFNISCRTRGGFNVRFSPEQMSNMIKTQTTFGMIDEGDDSKTEDMQLTLFDMEDN